MIHRIKGKYVLTSKKTGEVLGRHRYKWQAEAQETAIRISKARRSGHRIPYPQ